MKISHMQSFKFYLMRNESGGEIEIGEKEIDGSIRGVALTERLKLKKTPERERLSTLPLLPLPRLGS